MAKKSMIARDVKRKKLVERYAEKRKILIDAFKSAKDPMERLEIHFNSLPDCFKTLQEIYLKNIFLAKNNPLFFFIIYE